VKFWGILPTVYIDDKEFHISDTQLVLAHKIEKGNEYQRRCLSWSKQGKKIVIDCSVGCIFICIRFFIKKFGYIISNF